MEAAHHAAHAHEAHSDEHHHELNYWQKYIFSSDHKTIGIQYGFTALMFLFFGFCLMGLMRWSIAYPGLPLPLVGSLLHMMLGDAVTAVSDPKTQQLLGYALSPDLYNAFGAMHGTIMVFLAIVPLAFAAFEIGRAHV